MTISTRAKTRTVNRRARKAICRMQSKLNAMTRKITRRALIVWKACSGTLPGNSFRTIFLRLKTKNAPAFATNETPPNKLTLNDRTANAPATDRAPALFSQAEFSAQLDSVQTAEFAERFSADPQTRFPDLASIQHELMILNIRVAKLETRNDN